MKALKKTEVKTIKVDKVPNKPETQVFCVRLNQAGDEAVNKAKDTITELAKEGGYTLGDFSTQSAFDVDTRAMAYVVTATGTK